MNKIWRKLYAVTLIIGFATLSICLTLRLYWLAFIGIILMGSSAIAYTVILEYEDATFKPEYEQQTKKALYGGSKKK